VGTSRLQQAGAVELAEDRHDAAGAVHVLHVVRRSWPARPCTGTGTGGQAVDVGHGEVDAGLLRGGQQVQHGVGRAAHGDVERHGVLEGLEAGDVARQHAGRRPARSSVWQFDDQAAGLEEQALAVGVGGQQSSRCRAATGPAPRSGSSSSWR
jgi:hypothetical protein